MKKILSIIAICFLAFFITACSNSNNSKTDNDKNDEEEAQIQNWPRDTFFSLIPILADEVIVTKTEKSEEIKYLITINEISYKNFRNWIYKLEEMGFHYKYVNQLFPEKEDELPKETVSWTSDGLVNGIFITATYYSRETYQNKPKVVLSILNYDPRKNVN